MSVLTAGQAAVPPRVAVSHAPDRHKADGGLNVVQDDERAASFDSGNAGRNQPKGIWIELTKRLS